MFPTLETERLILREITNADVNGIYSCFSNEEVTKFYGQNSIHTVEEAKQFIEFFAKSYQEQRGIRWGIECRDTKEFLGTIGFNALSRKHKRAELGYELHPSHWRKGYAKEAIRAVLTYGTKDLGLTRIGAVVFLDNIASNNLLEGLGFIKEGVLKKYMYQNGVANDTNVYGFIPPE
ncbi:N-acetyltransferase [Anaerobacillus alkaliphilus]|uniref:N-acetyltransferase n=1 Tax=Anaerobacillus alkaliphilus TaxID=1548597 RepID=A0A4Q0VRP2_9BACI|nr:GNAT family N-acetyltransferase [Anaerobacillus alkaliphilus]RXI98587.1 N-acetyltransferase [Anaerobacillus alkaliphilus]